MNISVELPLAAGRPFGLSHKWVLLALFMAAAIPYLPFVHLPPLQDDYGHVWLAERYGSPAGWPELLRDPLYRCRSTSLVATWLTLQGFGYSNLAFHLSSILLHAMNAWLLYALGACRHIGWRVSAMAALIFAARERHHEAVIWYASLHELFVFAFVVLTLLAWVRWLQGGSRWWWLAVAGGWVLALASKESGILLMWLVPAFALLYPGRRKAAALTLALGSAASVLYFYWAQSHADEHLHFRDGTFSLGPHFMRTTLNSAARGLWIWGGVSLLALWWHRSKAPWKTVALAAAWFLTALIPYVFLTYMPRIPSRHHYLASGGAALLVAVAFWVFLEGVRRPRIIAAVLAASFLLHNCLYLWTYKRPQFEVRAELLEGLLREAARQSGEPVTVLCKEVLLHEARLAVHYRLGLDGDALIREAPSDGSPAGRTYRCAAPRPGE